MPLAYAAPGAPPPEEAALREVLVETGVAGEIIGRLPGEFRGDTDATVCYLVRPKKSGGQFGQKAAKLG